MGGRLLLERDIDWFNPNSFARQLSAKSGSKMEDANIAAWHFGGQQLEKAMAKGTNFAFETTLGAVTLPALLAEASATHDVVMWYCGLASLELHIQRVSERVKSGGHHIPEAKIRERWNNSRRNLIRLLPFLQHLQVFDNSLQAGASREIPPPVLLLEVIDGKVLTPRADDLSALKRVPLWARPIVEAAIEKTVRI